MKSRAGESLVDFGVKIEATFFSSLVVILEVIVISNETAWQYLGSASEFLLCFPASCLWEFTWFNIFPQHMKKEAYFQKRKGLPQRLVSCGQTFSFLRVSVMDEWMEVCLRWAWWAEGVSSWVTPVYFGNLPHSPMLLWDTDLRPQCKTSTVATKWTEVSLKQKSQSGLHVYLVSHYNLSYFWTGGSADDKNKNLFRVAEPEGYCVGKPSPSS